MPLAGIFLSLGAGLLCGAVGSVAYGYLDHWIPFIYLNVILTFAFGALIGAVVGAGAVRGKIRNAWFVAGAATLCALVSHYIAWIAWIRAISSGELMVVMPQEMIQVIPKIAEIGVWTLSGSKPTGTLLYCFWAGEALLVVGTAIGISWSMIANKPFCERCQKWLGDGRTLAPLVPLADQAGLRKRLEGNDYNGFADLRPLQEDEDNSKHTLVTLNHCDGCQKLHLLSLSAITITVNKKGETTRNEEVVTRNLLVEPEVHQRVVQIYLSPPSAPDESEWAEPEE